MTYYFSLVHLDKGSAFGVQFPDAPGCYSAADEAESLVSNAAEALSLYAEDAVLPAPRSIDEINVVPEVAAAISAGAFLVAVPFVENDAKVARVNLGFRHGIMKTIDAP